MAWHPTHTSPAPPVKPEVAVPLGQAQPTDLNLDPEADHDRFSHFEPDQPAPEQKVNAEDIPAPSDSPGQPSRSRWRAAGSGGTSFSDNTDR
jgi:hypothetical protein